MSSPLTTQFFINSSDVDKALPRSEESKEKHREYVRCWRRDPKNKERILKNKRASRIKHRDHAIQKCKEWYSKNRDEQLIWKRRYSRKVSEEWGSFGLQHKWNDEVVADSEKFVAEYVLPKAGFVDILQARPLVKRFPLDILAKDKNGIECGFDVKLGIAHCVKKTKIVLIRHLGIRYFIVHVNRSHTFYCIHDMSDKRSSSARKEFMDFVKKGEK